MKEKLLIGTETVSRLKGKIRMSIFRPRPSVQTEKKSKANRWNANSFKTLQNSNSLLQSTLKCHHNIVHGKVEG